MFSYPSTAGGNIGIVTAMSVSGIVCSRGSGEGWSYVFYTFGRHNGT